MVGKQRRLPTKTIKFFVKHREKATPGKTFSGGFIANHCAIPYEFTDKNELDIENKKDIPKSVVKYDEKFKFKQENDREVEISDQLLIVRNNLDNFPNVFYFSRNRDRDLKKGFSTSFQKIIDELNWRFFKKYCDDSKKETYVLKWEDVYEYIIDKVEDPKQSKIIHPLKEKLKSVLGDKFDKFEISLLNLKQPFEEAFFALRDKDQIISLSKLASGELMIMAYYFLRLTNELSKKDVIFLIDDIELHLHPQLQYKLFEEVKSSKFQHILNTHSDIFVDMVDWKTIKRFGQSNIYPNIELLSKKYGGSVNSEKELREHLDDIKMLCKDKTIFRREDNEILFSEKCLLVEGPKVKYGLLDLAKKLSYDFEKLTVKYCAGKGSIHYYQTICLTYGIDYFVVYDQDNQDKDSLIEELVV